MARSRARSRWKLGLLAGALAATGSAALAERPPADWTPSAEAPQGLLTPREAQLHDVFIDLARSGSSCTGAPLRGDCQPGGIDVVFFGSAFAERWSWKTRGLPAWRERIAPYNAVNFGSQGTRPESLLWRMQNGELDGYNAKLVVLWLAPSDERLDRDAFAAAYGPVISEIRARQPQATVVLFGTRHEAHSPVAFVDKTSVFYVSAPILSAEDRSGYRARAMQLESWLPRVAG